MHIHLAAVGSHPVGAAGAGGQVDRAQLGCHAVGKGGTHAGQGTWASAPHVTVADSREPICHQCRTHRHDENQPAGDHHQQSQTFINPALSRKGSITDADIGDAECIDVTVSVNPGLCAGNEPNLEGM